MGAEESTLGLTLSEEARSGGRMTTLGPSENWRQADQAKTLERFPRTSFIPGKPYGQGAFGNVVSGTLEGKFVIVKILHNPIPTESMTVIQEMCKLEHRNLVRFVGIIDLEPTDCPQLIFKNVNKGSLFAWLKNGKGPSDEKTLHKFACDIINGMEYLHSMDFIHGCLAARNILIDEFVQASSGSTYLNAKISDYGMTRVADGTGPNYYQIGLTKTLHLRWMPKEAIQTDSNAGEVTSASDVWSFAVILWEMCTKCDVPYGSSVSNTEVRQNILDGKSPLTFHRPVMCPDKVISMMNCIFKVNQNERPTFADLSKAFDSIQGGKRPHTKSNLSSADYASFKGQSSQLQSAQAHHGGDVRSRQSYQNNEKNPEKTNEPDTRGNVETTEPGNVQNLAANPHQKRFETARHPPSYREMAPPPYTPSMRPLLGYARAPRIGSLRAPRLTVAQGGSIQLYSSRYTHPPPMYVPPPPPQVSYTSSTNHTNRMPPPPPYTADNTIEIAETQAQRIKILEDKVKALSKNFLDSQGTRK